MTQKLPQNLHSIMTQKSKDEGIFIVQLNIIFGLGNSSLRITEVIEILDTTYLSEEAKRSAKDIIKNDTSDIISVCLFFDTVSEVKDLLDAFNTKFNRNTTLDLTFDVYSASPIEPKDIGLCGLDAHTHFKIDIKNGAEFLDTIWYDINS